MSGSTATPSSSPRHARAASSPEPASGEHPDRGDPAVLANSASSWPSSSTSGSSATSTSVVRQDGSAHRADADSSWRHRQRVFGEQQLADLAAALDDLHQLRVPVRAGHRRARRRAPADASTCTADAAPRAALAAATYLASTAAATISGVPSSQHRLACSHIRVATCSATSSSARCRCRRAGARPAACRTARGCLACRAAAARQARRMPDTAPRHRQPAVGQRRGDQQRQRQPAPPSRPVGGQPDPRRAGRSACPAARQPSGSATRVTVTPGASVGHDDGAGALAVPAEHHQQVGVRGAGHPHLGARRPRPSSPSRRIVVAIADRSLPAPGSLNATAASSPPVSAGR